jgi:flavin-dependent dehydrogenase
MPEPRPITIIGGGLAGLSLGVGLRQRNIPVMIWEAGSYPRHRVCGEFISGRGLELLRELGLWDALLKRGACTADTVAMIFGRKCYQHRLPASALCISRHALDHLLAREFERLGGVLKTGSRAEPGQSHEGLVRATGRNPRTTESGWHWFGIKGHIRNVSLMADLEMHYSQNAYIGLCALDGNRVNVCGLFRRKRNDIKPGRDLTAMLRGAPGTLLYERLDEGDWIPESICAVAGLSFGPLQQFTRMNCCVGDVLQMIPPLTGNGMSIAFESAGLALQPLADYAFGKLGWRDAEDSIARRFSEAFRARFWWANLLQRLAFSPGARACSPLFQAGSVFRFCFSRTR